MRPGSFGWGVSHSPVRPRPEVAFFGTIALLWAAIVLWRILEDVHGPYARGAVWGVGATLIAALMPMQFPARSPGLARPLVYAMVMISALYLRQVAPVFGIGYASAPIVAMLVSGALGMSHRGPRSSVS
jgi:hypothetical protein